MSKKRKISARRILQAFLTLVVTSGCIVAVMGASKLQRAKTLNDIVLHIKNENKYQFIDKQTLSAELIERKGIKEHTTKLSTIDVRSIEHTASKNPWVAEAQVYVDNNRNMHLYVSQRIPVARIFFENGESRYLDATLNLLPLSERFTYYTTIVTNVPVLNDDSVSKNLYAQIVRLVKFVERDTFWRAQIAQIIVMPNLQFELVPILGTQKILFGDTTQIVEKFGNLFAFYKNVLNRIGWDKYEVLDLRYKNQLIASPSLPWKHPTKNGISNMDWLKSIMGEAPINANAINASKAVAASNTTVRPIPPKKIEQQRKTTNTKTAETNAEPTGKYIYSGDASH